MSKDQVPELVNRPAGVGTYADGTIPGVPDQPREQPVETEMLARIDAARAHPSPGIPHAEIVREFVV